MGRYGRDRGGAGEEMDLGSGRSWGDDVFWSHWGGGGEETNLWIGEELVTGVITFNNKGVREMIQELDLNLLVET